MTRPKLEQVWMIPNRIPYIGQQKIVYIAWIMHTDFEVIVKYVPA